MMFAGRVVEGISAVRCLWLLALSPLLIPCARAQGERLFRIVSPAASVITSVSPDGTIRWTSAATGDHLHHPDDDKLREGWVGGLRAGADQQHGYDAPGVRSRPRPAAWCSSPPAASPWAMRFGEGYDDELPAHTVYVSGFYMDKYEVTKALWDKVKAWSMTNGYSFAGSGNATNHPVQGVSWYNAVTWCNARSQKEGLTPCYYTDAGLTTVYKIGPGEPLREVERQRVSAADRGGVGKSGAGRGQRAALSVAGHGQHQSQPRELQCGELPSLRPELPSGLSSDVRHRQLSLHQLRSGLCRPMATASTTWRAMCGSGAGIGTRAIGIARRARSRMIRAGRPDL